MNHLNCFAIGIVLCCLTSVPAPGQSVYPGQHNGLIRTATVCPLQAECFDLSAVRLGDSPFKENCLRSSRWLMSLPVKELLHSFRTNAGVYTEREGGYFTMHKLGGWESLDCDLRGHTTGHILSALAMLYASTADERFKTKADSLVSGLAEVQQALGNGYIGAYAEGLIDRNIQGKSVWAPWYTLHKIYGGLIDQYLYCDNKQALDVVCRAADWAYAKLSPLDEETRRKMIRNEFGGINEAFYNLYAITGDERHKMLAEFFYHNQTLDPLCSGEDNFDTKHANTFIPKLIGEARRYEMILDASSTDNHGVDTCRQIAEFFWQTVVNHHSYCTGSNSDKEHFFKPDQISTHLTGYTGESCCVYNMLKLTRHLFCWHADARYMDYYERALYNHILGQQDPATGMISYFLPMLPGAHKVYSTPRNSFWCCVGSGFESQSKYSESIYMHHDQDLFVNLFIPSTLDWKEKQMRLSMQTRYPDDGTVHIRIDSCAPNGSICTLQLRYPGWSNRVTVRVNGKNISVRQKAASYIAIRKKWKAGDVVEMNIAMPLRWEASNDNPAVGAFMVGPIALAGRLGTQGMTAPAPYSDPTKYNDYYTYDYHIPATMSHIIECKAGQETRLLTSRSADSISYKMSNGIVLEPIAHVHRERYTIYWQRSK